MKATAFLAYPEINSFLCRGIYKHLFIVKSSKKRIVVGEGKAND